MKTATIEELKRLRDYEWIADKHGNRYYLLNATNESVSVNSVSLPYCERKTFAVLESLGVYAIGEA